MAEPGRDDSRLRFGVPACATARDRVDRVLLDWDRERPDLDFTPAGVVSRLARARSYLDVELAAVFARFGLTSADFGVIITLRRSGLPYTMPQARLMDALGLTSGTVSVRIDRLEQRGIVSREPDPGSTRGSLVRLTGKGLRLFDEVAPVHLANEDRLLSALSRDERQTLADLLRRLLAGFESSTTDVAAGLRAHPRARPPGPDPAAGCRAVGHRRPARHRCHRGQRRRCGRDRTRRPDHRPRRHRGHEQHRAGRAARGPGRTPHGHP